MCYELGVGLERPFCAGCHTNSEVKTAFAHPSSSPRNVNTLFFNPTSVIEIPCDGTGIHGAAYRITAHHGTFQPSKTDRKGVTIANIVAFPPVPATSMYSVWCFWSEPAMMQPVLAGHLQCDEQLVVNHVFCTTVLDKRSTMSIAPEFKDLYLDWGCMEYDRVGRARNFCCGGYGFVASVCWN